MNVKGMTTPSYMEVNYFTIYVSGRFNYRPIYKLKFVER